MASKRFPPDDPREWLGREADRKTMIPKDCKHRSIFPSPWGASQTTAHELH